jgi:hypothetical protein
MRRIAAAAAAKQSRNPGDSVRWGFDESGLCAVLG